MVCDRDFVGLLRPTGSQRARVMFYVRVHVDRVRLEPWLVSINYI